MSNTLQAAVDHCVTTFETWDLLDTSFAQFTCEQANAIALIFAAGGHHDFAHHVIQSHAYGDREMDSGHHGSFLAQTVAR